MAQREVLVIGYDGAELLDIACVTTTLTTALTTAALITGTDPSEQPYRVRLLTPGGRPITCSSGLELRAHGSLEHHHSLVDTVVVSGGFGSGRAAANPQLIGQVQRLATLSRRVASVCTGVGVLAAAGLLDGRRATTHWGFADLYAHQYPAVRFDAEPIYIRDGRVYTSAGVTAALDLTLALIAEDLGEARAREVARALVTYLKRPGNQAQISLHIAAPAPADPVVQRTIEHINRQLAGDLSPATLARNAGISPRHLSRLFRTHVGQTPTRYVRQVRAEAAAQLLATTSLPVARVAQRCGFGTSEALRSAFIATYGVPPSRLGLISNRPD